MPCLIGWSSTRQDKTRTTARQLKNVQAGQMKESAASIDHIHGPKPITPFEFGFACSIYDHGRRRNEYVRKQAISKYIPVGHISSQNAILNQSQKKKKKPTQTQQPFVQDPFSANVFFRAYTLTQLPDFRVQQDLFYAVIKKLCTRVKYLAISGPCPILLCLVTLKRWETKSIQISITGMTRHLGLRKAVCKDGPERTSLHKLTRHTTPKCLDP